MTRDPLAALLRVQRLAVDERRRTLGECLARERAAEAVLTEAEQAITRETRAAERSSDDAEVEAFARWLPRGRQAVHDAAAARDYAANQTARARSALTLARSTAEATENLMEQRRQAARIEALRKQQAELDELGLRKKTGLF